MLPKEREAKRAIERKREVKRMLGERERQRECQDKEREVATTVWLRVRAISRGGGCYNREGERGQERESGIIGSRSQGCLEFSNEREEEISQ